MLYKNKGGVLMGDIEGIGRKFKRLHNIMENDFNKEMAKSELTRSQMEVLIYLMSNRLKDISGRDIEKFFDLTNPTVTGILNRLEAKGFIVREISPDDARSKYIKVTEKAIESKREAKKVMKQVKEKLFEGITKEEIETINTLLEKMLNNMT